MDWIKRLFGGRQKSFSLKEGYLANLIAGYSSDRDIAKPYPEHTAFFSAVRSKARNIAQVPFRLYRGDVEITDDTKDPMAVLFRLVNPYCSRYDLWESIVTCLEVWGEAFVIKDRETVNNVPVALWPQLPEMIKERVYRNHLVAWELRREGAMVVLYPEEVIHFKYYNPYNYFRGLSPILGGLIEEIKIDGKARAFNRRFFENDGALGTVFRTEQVLTDEQYRRLREQLIEGRTEKQAFKAIIVDGGLDAKNIGASLKDMSFIELRKFAREEVAMVTGVPKAELQLYEDMNYATARTADLNYWKKTLIPLMRKIEDKINQDLLSELGYSGWFDIEATGVLNEEFLQMVDAAHKLYQMGIPLKEINRRLDLGFDENALEEIEAQAVEQITEGKADKEKGLAEKAAKSVFRDEYWRKRIVGVAPFYARASRRVKDYFYSVEQAIIKKVTKGSGAWIRKSEAGEDINLDEIDALFSDERLRGVLFDVLKDTLKYSLKNVAYPSEVEEAVLGRRMNKIKGINETARKEVKERLQQALIDSMREGVPEVERAQIVISAIKDAMNVNEHRARTIARTEVHGVYNEGLWEKTKITKPKRLMWVTARDDRVRDTHENLDGEVIEYGNRFSNGLRFPMDPEGPAEEVINCRCTYLELFE